MNNELEDIKKFIENNLTIKLSLREDQSSLRTQRFIQHLFSVHFQQINYQKLYMTILDHVAKSEKACPGAGIKLLQKFVFNELKNYEDIIFKNDLIEKINNLDISQKSLSLLLESLALCDKNTKIKLKKSRNQKIYIQQVCSYFFKSNNLLANKKNTQEKNAKVIVIDGYIENVSELHHIFQHFSINSPTTPLVIFCRGMSDDVLHTVSVNNLRGSLNCYPIKIDFGLEDINTLVDIAVVCGSDVISSNKGELISSIKLSQLCEIKDIFITSEGVHIKNDATRKNTETHVKNLQKKSEEQTVEDVKNLLHKRIHSLTSNLVEISIPDDINFYSTSKELDEGIRLISATISGATSLKETVEFYHSSLLKTLSNTVMFS